MKTNEKVALCNNLNMNFDEALELFCEESLQSMQMAKVNGGVAPILVWILKELFRATVAGAAAYIIYVVTEKNGNKPTESKRMVFIQEEDGFYSSDGLKLDSVIGNKVYLSLPTLAPPTNSPTK